MTRAENEQNSKNWQQNKPNGNSPNQRLTHKPNSNYEKQHHWNVRHLNRTVSAMLMPLTQTATFKIVVDWMSHQRCHHNTILTTLHHPTTNYRYMASPAKVPIIAHWANWLKPPSDWLAYCPIAIDNWNRGPHHKLFARQTWEVEPSCCKLLTLALTDLTEEAPIHPTIYPTLNRLWGWVRVPLGWWWLPVPMQAVWNFASP